MDPNELFSPEPLRRNGYRLRKLEVYNWGTFDGEVFSVRPTGQTTLLVGQNGSGKSTLVDALLTLLVKPGVRNFNVAAGAKKTERDERSYLKGAYDRSSDEDGHGVQVKFLRPKGDEYSVILACFHNIETSKTFTIAQFLYLGPDQKVEKIHCFSASEGSIRDDFSKLGPTDGLLKTLRQRGWQVTKTFAEYDTWFNRTVRAKPKAMEVFNQTVAVKDIQRLNDFIRHHMLEPHPWTERVDRLLGHFAQLRDAHQALVRVRQQFESLEPIARLGTSYAEEARELVDAERLLAAVDAFFSQKTVDILTPELTRRGEELTRIRFRKDTLASDINLAQEECRRLRNQIEVAGGPRLQEIPLLIRAEQAYAKQKKTEYERFLGALSRAGLPQSVLNEQHFASIRDQLPALRAELTGSIGRWKNDYDALVLKRGEVRHALAETRQEFESLQQRRENLPDWCAALRQSLCDDLGLHAKDLPFAAELISVLDEEHDWEPSIEKVLRGFALSLLTPERLYRIVSSHVDRTRLADSRGRGQRLVYLRVGEPELETQRPSPAPDSLLRKLAFREGHPFLPWVKTELQRHFDYRCCESIQEFQQSRSLALTRSRHVKSEDRRHEKDDREQAIDPRSFVLGWDNREKKKRMGRNRPTRCARDAASATDRSC